MQTRPGTHLLSRANTPIDFLHESPPNHLVQDDSRPRVQNLLICRSIALILHIRMCTWSFPIDAGTETHTVGFIDVSQAGGIF